MAKAIVISPNEIPVRVAPLIDYTDRLVFGSLTDDSIQYSEEVTTGEANIDVVAFQKLIDPVMEGKFVWVEFNLTAEFRAVSSDVADLTWKWQARNRDGSWVDLHPAVLEAHIGTTYVTRSKGGYFQAIPNLNAVPFELRLSFQCNMANEGRARVRNSSYVRVVYSTI